MRCTRCDRSYAPDDDSLMTTVAEQISGPGSTGAQTRQHQVFLCPRCVASRRQTERVFAWSVALAAGVILLAVIWRYL